MECEMCNKKKEIICNVTAMECSAKICRRCVKRLRDEGHEVKIHSEERKVY